MENRCNWIID